MAATQPLARRFPGPPNLVFSNRSTAPLRSLSHCLASFVRSIPPCVAESVECLGAVPRSPPRSVENVRQNLATSGDTSQSSVPRTVSSLLSISHLPVSTAARNRHIVAQNRPHRSDAFHSAC